ncbi:hypothetical protein ACIQCR_02400 [Streptomyces sp. NPDC093249]|uniref:hypothetical protein n=1 Tax=unclassified Streptomyces TaxID=2593676 RepID=UPI00344E941F
MTNGTTGVHRSRRISRPPYTPGGSRLVASCGSGTAATGRSLRLAALLGIGAGFALALAVGRLTDRRTSEAPRPGRPRRSSPDDVLDHLTTSW